MFIYHEELDQTKSFYLTVINKRKTDHSFDNNIMSNEFFIKYNFLFNLIEELKLILNSSVLSNTNSFWYSKLKSNIERLLAINKTVIYDFNIIDLELYLLLWGENFDLLYNLNLYSVEHDKYIKIMRLFTDALTEIAYVRKKVKNVNLPNTWFITSKGYLYNTRSTLHSAGIFKNYYDELNKNF